jgi:hypothetical protein
MLELTKATACLRYLINLPNDDNSKEENSLIEKNERRQLGSSET